MPEAALHEALLNALCHKRYQSGVPIQISVYEDKLYIANCGCLPKKWSLANLMDKHASVPFNPNIAHFKDKPVKERLSISALICSAAKEFSNELVVVGGSAVEFYTAASYMTKDIDFDYLREQAKNELVEDVLNKAIKDVEAFKSGETTFH